MVGCWEWLKSDTMTREVRNYEDVVRNRMEKNRIAILGHGGGTRKRKPISLRRTRRR